MHTTQCQQRPTTPYNAKPNCAIQLHAIPNHTIQHHATPYHGAIRQGEVYKTSLYFWYFYNLYFSVSSQRGGGGLEVFTLPLLQSIHTVSILLMDRFYTFLLYFLYFLLYYVSENLKNLLAGSANLATMCLPSSTMRRKLNLS